MPPAGRRGALRRRPALASAFALGPIPGLCSVLILSMEQFVALHSNGCYQFSASWQVYDFGTRGMCFS